MRGCMYDYNVEKLIQRVFRTDHMGPHIVRSMHVNGQLIAVDSAADIKYKRVVEKERAEQECRPKCDCGRDALDDDGNGGR